MRDNLWEDLIKALDKHENKHKVSKIGMYVTRTGHEGKREYDLVSEVCLEVVKVNDKLVGKSHSKKKGLTASCITRSLNGELRLFYRTSPWGGSESIVFDQSWFTKEGRKEIIRQARESNIKKMEQQVDAYLLKAGKLLERIDKLKKEEDNEG